MFFSATPPFSLFSPTSTLVSMAMPMVRTTETTSTAFLSHSSRFLPSPLPLFFPCQPGTLHFRRQFPFHSPQSLSSSSLSSSTSSRPSIVSTVPVVQAPDPVFDFENEIARLQTLHTRLSQADTLCEKLRVVDIDDRVRGFFRSGRSLPSLDLKEEFLIKCLIAAGQGHTLGWEAHHDDGTRGHRLSGGALKEAFYRLADTIERWNRDEVGVVVKQHDVWNAAVSNPLKMLVKILDDVEEFYDCIGGIIGYQLVVLELLSPLTSKRKFKWFSDLNVSYKSQIQKFHVPVGVNLLENTEYASQAALWGLEGLPELGEIYPLGGAGDRLGLVDSNTGKCLPAAMLPYCGRTLLEGLIRDLQAREFLHFKIFGKQQITPVAIMTSSVKNNHKHILALCEKHGWFGRGQQKFQLFEQPMVPVVAAENGQWLINEPLSLVCNPGGHGAIWKLAYDKGIFQWFNSLGRKGATIRQVSNVVAATDVTLLALAGIGLRHKKKFGFASCQRNFGAMEGVNVLVEKQNEDGRWAYGLSCIEYTEFDKYDINDVAVSLGRLQAGFPSNTNILYVDLKAAESIGGSKCRKCLPGMVLNLKKPVYVNHLGIQHSVSGGRLECTMQNIADNFFNTYASTCREGIEGSLDTFIVYNERKRVTSSAKRKRKITDKTLHQTPDGSFLDVIRNASDLLSKCDINIPKIADNSKYIHFGPPFIVLLHPALGPLWEVTRQKFFGGSISKGSELQVEVAEFLWRNVQLDGSLIIVTENVMGSTRNSVHGEPILHYGNRCGRCKLNNVKVLNRGIDWLSPKNVYWKQDIKRFEMLKILLHGNAEFEATNVVLEGHHVFEVLDGYRMCVISSNAGFQAKLEPIKEEMIETGSWFWEYSLSGSHIQLKQVIL